MTKTYNPIQYQQSRGYEIASENTSQNWGSNQDCPFDIQTGNPPFLRVRSIIFLGKGTSASGYIFTAQRNGMKIFKRHRKSNDLSLWSALIKVCLQKKNVAKV